MQDRFKFRAWDWDIMTEVMSMQSFKAIQHYSYDYIHDDETFNKRIIMQSTGLTDVNNKLIFEGDVISVDDGFHEEYTTHKIVWGEDYPSFEISPNPIDECNGFMYMMIECRVTIIGNIYENPELIK